MSLASRSARRMWARSIRHWCYIGCLRGAAGHHLCAAAGSKSDARWPRARGGRRAPVYLARSARRTRSRSGAGSASATGRRCGRRVRAGDQPHARARYQVAVGGLHARHRRCRRRPGGEGEAAAGVVATGNTLDVRLKRPVPDFPARAGIPVRGAAGAAGRPRGSRRLSRPPARTTSPSTAPAEDRPPAQPVLRRRRDGTTSTASPSTFASARTRRYSIASSAAKRTGAGRSRRSTSIRRGGWWRSTASTGRGSSSSPGRRSAATRSTGRVRCSGTTRGCGRR